MTMANPAPNSIKWSYTSPQTMQAYRTRFQSVYGVMLTDDEINEFNSKLKKASIAASSSTRGWPSALIAWARCDRRYSRV